MKSIELFGEKVIPLSCRHQVLFDLKLHFFSNIFDAFLFQFLFESSKFDVSPFKFRLFDFLIKYKNPSVKTRNVYREILFVFKKRSSQLQAIDFLITNKTVEVKGTCRQQNWNTVITSVSEFLSTSFLLTLSNEAGCQLGTIRTLNIASWYWPLTQKAGLSQVSSVVLQTL